MYPRYLSHQGPQPTTARKVRRQVRVSLALLPPQVGAEHAEGFSGVVRGPSRSSQQAVADCDANPAADQRAVVDWAVMGRRSRRLLVPAALAGGDRAFRLRTELLCWLATLEDRFRFLHLPSGSWQRFTPLRVLAYCVWPGDAAKAVLHRGRAPPARCAGADSARGSFLKRRHGGAVLLPLGAAA